MFKRKSNSLISDKNEINDNSWLIHGNYMLKETIMKKQYMKPQMEVVNINHSVQLLAGSGKPDQWGAPEFNSDDMQEMQNLLFGE